MKHSSFTNKTTGTVLGLVLIFSGSAIAQQIPFDYFYGRIIGRQQLGLHYYDAEAQKARIDGSLYFGFRDHFRFGVDRLFTWIPNEAEDALRWNEPPLRGDIQLANGLRLHHNLAVWDQESSTYISEGIFEHYDRTSAYLDQSLVFLQNAGVDYDPQASLYYYLEGLWLNPSQSQVGAAWNFSFLDHASEIKERSSYFSRRDSEAFDNSHSWGVTAEFTRGLGEDFNLHLEGRMRRFGSNRDSRSLQEYYYDSDPDYDNYIFEGDGTLGDYYFGVSSIYKPRPNAWLTVGLIEQVSLRDSYSRGERDRSAGSDLLDIRYQYYSDWISTFSLAFDWISRDMIVPYEQVLDNFQYYYGIQLPSNTLRISGHSAFGYREHADESFNYRNSTLLGYSLFESFDRNLDLDFQVSYHFHPTLRCLGSVQIRRRMSDISRAALSYHSQTTAFAFTVDYHKFTWKPDQSNPVSWDGISDIDYLLGAMTRPDDFRLSFIFRPPVYSANFRDDETSLFNFFKGQDDGRWSATLEAESGFWSFLAVKVGSTYKHGPFYPGSLTSWTRTRSITVQPTAYARFSLSWDIINYYYSDAVYSLNPGFSRDTKTKSVNARLDIVI